MAPNPGVAAALMRSSVWTVVSRLFGLRFMSPSVTETGVGRQRKTLV
jgi:hypothetical protein